MIAEFAPPLIREVHVECRLLMTLDVDRRAESQMNALHKEVSHAGTL